MIKTAVPEKIWAEMNDHEKIERVVIDARNHHPALTREYLIDFLADVAQAYREETETRKMLARSNIAWLFIVMALAILSVFGIKHLLFG
jgi:hypothetical protein